MQSIIYAVKGGIPNVASSTNPNFYALCYDFYSNIGYIEKKGANRWRLYTRYKSLLTQHKQFGDDKYYFHGVTFKKCINNLREMSGKLIETINRKKVEKILNLKNAETTPVIIRLNTEEIKLLNDRILANYFSNLKYIQAFQNRSINLNRFLFEDRFSLKTFLQEFNVIRHISKDGKEVQEEGRNLIRLAKVLKDKTFNPNDIDEVAAQLKVKGISKVNAVSMTSKISFLGNPEEIFIYDRFVKTAIGFKNPSLSYQKFYERITKLTADKNFQDYILEIQNNLNEKLELIENWADFVNDNKSVRKMRIIDSYFMFLGMKGKSIFVLLQ